MPSIKYKKKTYAGATFPVLEMTKAEYDALPEAKKMDGTVYMITDDTGGWEAERSVYDNTTSGLTATNVQDALDEIAGDVSAIHNLKRVKVYEAQVDISTSSTDISFTFPSDFHTSYGVILSRSWPISTWSNGAVVTIAQDSTITAGSSTVRLATTYAQKYNVRLDLVYE